MELLVRGIDGSGAPLDEHIRDAMASCEWKEESFALRPGRVVVIDTSSVPLLQFRGDWRSCTYGKLFSRGLVSQEKQHAALARAALARAEMARALNRRKVAATAAPSPPAALSARAQPILKSSSIAAASWVSAIPAATPAAPRAAAAPVDKQDTHVTFVPDCGSPPRSDFDAGDEQDYDDDGSDERGGYTLAVRFPGALNAPSALQMSGADARWFLWLAALDYDMLLYGGPGQTERNSLRELDDPYLHVHIRKQAIARDFVRRCSAMEHWVPPPEWWFGVGGASGGSVVAGRAEAGDGASFARYDRALREGPTLLWLKARDACAQLARPHPDLKLPPMPWSAELDVPIGEGRHLTLALAGPREPLASLRDLRVHVSVASTGESLGQLGLWGGHAAQLTGGAGVSGWSAPARAAWRALTAPCQCFASLPEISECAYRDGAAVWDNCVCPGGFLATVQHTLQTRGENPFTSRAGGGASVYDLSVKLKEDGTHDGLSQHDFRPCAWWRTCVAYTTWMRCLEWEHCDKSVDLYSVGAGAGAGAGGSVGAGGAGGAKDDGDVTARRSAAFLRAICKDVSSRNERYRGVYAWYRFQDRWETYQPWPPHKHQPTGGWCLAHLSRKLAPWQCAHCATFSVLDDRDEAFRRRCDELEPSKLWVYGAFARVQSLPEVLQGDDRAVGRAMAWAEKALEWTHCKARKAAEDGRDATSHQIIKRKPPHWLAAGVQPPQCSYCHALLHGASEEDGWDDDDGGGGGGPPQKRRRRSHPRQALGWVHARSAAPLWITNLQLRTVLVALGGHPTRDGAWPALSLKS